MTSLRPVETAAFDLACEPQPGATGPPQPPPRASLLGLPLELRLQIYGWVHVNTPVSHRQLVPWLPVPSHRPYIVRAITNCSGGESPTEEGDVEGGVDNDEQDKREEEKGEAPCSLCSSRRLLCPYRLLSKMPTGLLASCKTVYFEAREIPFRENEFVFSTWFSSGLSTARHFTKGLAGWQRDCIQHARLELRPDTDFTPLPGTDYAATSPTISCETVGIGAFVQLCRFWAPGLRTLRIKLDAAPASLQPAAAAAPPEEVILKLVDEGGHGAAAVAPPTWIGCGLRSLTGLRSLEVELANSQLADCEKLAWCAKLQDLVNHDGGASDDDAGTKTLVSVVAVEKASKAHPACRSRRLAAEAPRRKA